MAEVINLRQARKARDRKVRATEADANRALHGRTKSERANDAAEQARREALLNGAKRED
ncbi:MAG: DUF4169 family protein [Pseudomonadota bacterium]